MYRSPSATAQESAQLLEYSRRVASNVPLLLIMGDFSAPEVNWNRQTAPKRSFVSGLVAFLHSGGLVQ